MTPSTVAPPGAAPSAAPSAAFDLAFARTVGIEGGYTADPADPGNWTGGAPGRGTCKGTRWGISAASYPGLDIRNLSIEAAKAIYRRDFWDKISGDALPPALAGLAFDAAVNNGLERAKIWVQAAAGVHTDGNLGPVTLAAVARAAATPAGLSALCCEFQARRMDFMACLGTWPHFGLGWARRLCHTLADSVPPLPRAEAGA